MSNDVRLDQARSAVERGEWQQALDLLDSSSGAGVSALGLELRAQAAYGNGNYENAISAWEDL